MDINEYISSGILELYVAGALEPDEMREVEGYAARHAEIRAEIAAIEGAVAALARTDRNPRPELRAEIISRIARAESRDSADAPPPFTVTPIAPVPPAPMLRYLLAASIVLAVISSAVAVYCWYQWSQAEMELADAKESQQRTLNEVTAFKTRLDRTTEALAVLRSPGNRMVELKGLAVAPAAAARVYWNPATRETHLDPGTLPPAPAGKQYQLWAIAARGPVDAGVIVKDQDAGLQRMKDITGATAFAITLEPEGGRPTPTLDQMYAMGKITG